MIPILIENLANKKKPNNNKLSTINNVKKKENYTQKYEINKKKTKNPRVYGRNCDEDDNDDVDDTSEKTTILAKRK